MAHPAGPAPHLLQGPLCANLDELDADIAFVGMPFDQGTLGRPGARYGPDAIRDAPRAYSYADPFGAISRPRDSTISRPATNCCGA